MAKRMALRRNRRRERIALKSLKRFGRVVEKRQALLNIRRQVEVARVATEQPLIPPVVVDGKHSVDPHRARLGDGHHLLGPSVGRIHEVFEIDPLRRVESALSRQLRPCPEVRKFPSPPCS